MRGGTAGGFFLIVCACLGMSFPAFGGEQVLTLDEALEQALENNLNLKKNLIDLSLAEYSAKRLWSEIFPGITASASAGYSSELFTGEGFVLDKKGFTPSASLGLSLALNAGIPYTMKNIRLAYQSRLLGYEDASRQLEIQVTKNFFSLIAERENLAVLEETLKLAEQQLEKNQTAFNNGLVRELAVLQSRLGVETARYNLSAARTAYGNSMGEFLLLLGMEQNGETRLLGKMEVAKVEADTEALVRDYLPRRPDIVSRRQEIERLENIHKQTLFSARAPSLSLSAQWEGRNIDPFTDTLRGTATVSIPVDPWIPGTAKDQSVRAAKAGAEKAKLDLKSAEDSALAQIRSLGAGLGNSWNSVEIARLGLEVAERTYQLTDEGFKNGAVESLVLEDARNSLAEARQRLLQSRLAYLNMTLDLSAALNINWKDLTK